VTSGGQEVVRWVAITSMVVDHIGALLLPELAVLRMIGRLAWPLFAYLLAYNVAVRGVEPLRYLRPLLGWGILSVAPHVVAFGSGELNIMFTLALAVLAIYGLQRGGGWLALVPLALLLGVVVSYGPLGVLLPVVLWWALHLRDGVGSLVGASGVLVSNGLTAWSLFALPALGIPWLVNRLRLELPRVRRLGWAFYPLHLVILLGAVGLVH
jgi:hypothetical protein